MGDNTVDEVPHAPDNNSTESEVQHIAQMETTQRTLRQEQPTAEPSLQLPTKEFLEKSLKSDLQKRCRELGINNIWTNKSQLADMILEKLRSVPNDTLPSTTPSNNVIAPSSNDSTPTHADTGHEGLDLLSDSVLSSSPNDNSPIHADNTEHEELNLLHIAREVKMMKSKLETKDMEIELLNAEVKAAYHTIEHLQQRVTELEKHHCGNGEQNTSTGDTAPPKTCLLLGDKNLSTIRRSDLHPSCCVRTIPGANMDLLRSWVSEKLSTSPSKCIIYSGTVDIIEEHSTANILDNLGSLISDLKEKNNNMNVSVCQIVPYTMQKEIKDKIEDFNNHLLKWGETNGISIINTIPVFTLGTGELDDLCFNEKTEVQPALNRLGAIKLLTTINKQCPQFSLCPNWEKVKRNTNTYALQPPEQRSADRGNTIPTQRPPNSLTGPPARSQPAHLTDFHHPKSYTHNTSPHYHSSMHSRPPSQHLSTVPRATSHLPPARTTGIGQGLESGGEGARNSNTYAAALRGAAAEERHHMAHNGSLLHTSNTRGRHEDNSPPISTPTSALWGQEHYPNLEDSQHYQRPAIRHRDIFRNQPQNRNNERTKVGCYHCGEFNHVKATCRFDHKLLCGICRHLGHKSRLCQYYSK